MILLVVLIGGFFVFITVEEHTDEIIVVPDDDDCGGLVTMYGVNDEDVWIHWEECKQEFFSQTQIDTLQYYVVWGTTCQFRPHCAEERAREEAAWDMSQLLQERYGDVVATVDYEKMEEIYVNSKSVGGGWYSAVVAIYLKKQNIEAQIDNQNNNNNTRI